MPVLKGYGDLLGQPVQYFLWFRANACEEYALPSELIVDKNRMVLDHSERLHYRLDKAELLLTVEMDPRYGSLL